jgi:hypothetical protein
MAHPSTGLVCPAAAMKSIPYQTPVTAGSWLSPTAHRGMTRREFSNALFMFLLSPLLPALSATLKFGSKYATYIWVIFIGIFGYHIIFSPTSDGAKHAQTLTLYADTSFSAFVSESLSILTFTPVQLGSGRTQDDLFLHVLMYGLSRFSVSKEALFLVVGLIYGFFYVSSIQRVHALAGSRWNVTLATLFILFVFWRGLDGISGIRFFLGMWVLFYGALRHYETGQSRYLILACAAPLVHVGHVLTIIPLLAVRIFGVRPAVYLGILIMSFLFTVVNVSQFTQWAGRTQVGQDKVQRYVSETTSVGYFNPRGREAFHARWQLPAGKLVFTVLLLYALATSGYIKRRLSPLLGQLLSMGILLLSISNMATFSIAVNLRVGITAGLFILAFLTIFYSQLQHAGPGVRTNPRVFDALVIILMPASALFLFTQFSMIGDYMDLRTLLSPALYPFLAEGPISIKEFIRMVLP